MRNRFTPPPMPSAKDDLPRQLNYQTAKTTVGSKSLTTCGIAILVFVLGMNMLQAMVSLMNLQTIRYVPPAILVSVTLSFYAVLSALSPPKIRPILALIIILFVVIINGAAAAVCYLAAEEVQARLSPIRAPNIASTDELVLATLRMIEGACAVSALGHGALGIFGLVRLPHLRAGNTLTS